MKNIDSKKFITKSKVISDIRRIKNKFYKDVENLLKKCDAPAEDNFYETKINALEAENKRLKQEIAELHQQIVIKNEPKHESGNKIAAQSISDGNGNIDSLKLTPKEERDLQTIGRSWFVSRLYSVFHNEHKNWASTPEKSYSTKESAFARTQGSVYKKYLQNILSSSEIRLGRNEIGLSGAEIKKMAIELLKRLDFDSVNIQNCNEAEHATSPIKPSSSEPAIGKLVRTKLIPNLSNGKVAADEIQELKKLAYSTKTFGIRYPLLSKERFDTNGYPRYYAKQIQIDGDYWYVCQEWYDKNLSQLRRWLISHNID